jgi:hypothetical protein
LEDNFDDLDEQELVTADGFDAAIIGVGYRCGQLPLVVYSVEKAIEILQNDMGMSWEDATEYFSFNVENAWVGNSTPLWVYESEAADLLSRH